MRALILVAILAMLTVPAFAQKGGGGRGPGAGEQQQQSEQKRKQAAEAERAYKAGLERIPDAGKKSDPWGDLRGTDSKTAKPK